MKNIAEILKNKSNDKIALIFEEKTWTYTDLDQITDLIAQKLQSQGFKQGDCACLFLPNIPEFVFFYYAIQKLGGIAVSVNVMFKTDELQFILSDSEAKVLISTKDLMNNLSKVQTPLILVDEDEFNYFLPENQSLNFQSPIVSEHDPAAILYTSGTTGFPKGATLSQKNIISNIQATEECCEITANDNLLLFLPLFHCFGQNFILNTGFHSGATIVLKKRFELSETLKIISKHKITVFYGVPTIFIKLLQTNLENYDLSSIRFYFSAAASLPKEIANKWFQRFGFYIHEGYGLTETSPFASFNHKTKYKFDSVGTPIKGVEIKIVNPETEEELAYGEVGEIMVKGPNIMLGYWNRPTETAEALKDNWLKSGDLGWLDDENYLYIVDRLKDMINVSGFNVYPAEVENTVYQHFSVAEVAVYGVFDEISGEKVKANIVLKNGFKLSAQELIDFCKEKMAAYKVPKEIEFVNELPKNATGKVLKKDLKRLPKEAFK